MKRSSLDDGKHHKALNISVPCDVEDFLPFVSRNYEVMNTSHSQGKHPPFPSRDPLTGFPGVS